VSGLRAGTFAKQLAANGARVSVLSALEDGEPHIEDEGGIRVARLLRDPWHALHRSGLSRQLTTARHILDRGPYPEWVERGISLIKEGHLEAPDVVWGIGSDSPHELAKRSGALWGRPWIPDFKDDWGSGKHGTGRVLAAARTRQRLKTATHITSASSVGAVELARRFGVDASVIYSGVDLAHWRNATPADLGPHFNIVFTGHVAEGRIMLPEIAMGGLTQAVREAGLDAVRLHYFGHDGGLLRAHLGSCPEIFVDHGFQDHEAIASVQSGADLLLHLPYVDRAQVCVKFLEYVATQRPVLCVPGEPDGLGRIFTTRDGVFTASSPEEVSRLVTRLINAKATASLPSFQRALDAYTWEAQTKSLITVLERVVQSTGENDGRSA
jgi:hypothetical protein